MFKTRKKLVKIWGKRWSKLLKVMKWLAILKILKLLLYLRLKKFEALLMLVGKNVFNYAYVSSEVVFQLSLC